MPKLNQRQLLFCEALLAGASQAEAYRRAGYSPVRAESKAAELVRTPAVSSYLSAKRAKSEQAGEFLREDALRLLHHLATSGDTSSSRVAAIAQAAKMQGWNAAEKQEHSVSDNLAALLAKVRGRA
jgi:phage terminase small subunit